MSFGDFHRREYRVAELRERLQVEAEQEEALKVASRRLPISYVRPRDDRPSLFEDPAMHLQYVAKEREAKLARLEPELRRRAEEELAECTFRPKVNAGAPDFVYRIAESCRAARSLREKENRADARGGRPDWR